MSPHRTSTHPTLSTEGPRFEGESAVCLERLLIRAHYLALDLRLAAQQHNSLHAAATSMVAEMLTLWAMSMGRQLAPVQDRPAGHAAETGRRETNTR
jgi:hypothetical protein